MNLINQIWDFFSSVKLAIFTLSTLAVTSIIGTVIPQGESHSFYMKKYGVKTAQFMQILDVPEMYYSWWFLTLLGLLSCNLIVCSVERIPRVWKIITADNLGVSPDRLNTMRNSRTWVIADTSSFDTRIKDILKKSDWNTTTKGINDGTLFFSHILKTLGWNSSTRKVSEGTLFFSQKGKWSRIGVYIVHISILVIFLGAIVGHFGGFKGNVMLPELRATKKIFSSEDQSPIDLGFELRCNKFVVDFYENGMPKEFVSSLTVLENGQETLTRDIEVNGPLTYKGITFYQSSYKGYKDFIFHITEENTGESKKIPSPYQKVQSWEEKNIRFGVLSSEIAGQRIIRSKIWVKVGDHPSTSKWLPDNTSTTIAAGSKNYIINVKQLYATGLQVSRDPGVWIVYLGCTLMLIGLYMAFFMTHRRLWLLQKVENSGITIILAGNSNKNRLAFTQQFEQIASGLDRELPG